MTYNNFDFRGHQRWRDYKDVYAAWSRRLHIKKIIILGGEPFIHPDFIQWLDGILELWPTSQIEITSNGTQLAKYPEVYSRLEQHKDRLMLAISAHGIVQKHAIVNHLKSWMHGNVTAINVPDDNEISTWLNSYKNVKDVSWPECNHPVDYIKLPDYVKQECESVYNLSYQTWYENLYSTHVSNDLGVKVYVTLKNKFFNNAIAYNQIKNTVSLQNNNINDSYAACCARSNNPEIFVHQFSKGKLHKCSTVSLLPDFLEQFEMDISDEDKDLIKKYKPCTIDSTDEELTNFIMDLKKDKPIAQCKFCQDTTDLHAAFEAGPKKIKLYRRPALSSIG